MGMRSGVTQTSAAAPKENCRAKTKIRESDRLPAMRNQGSAIAPRVAKMGARRWAVPGQRVERRAQTPVPMTQNAPTLILVSNVKAAVRPQASASPRGDNVWMQTKAAKAPVARVAGHQTARMRGFGDHSPKHDKRRQGREGSAGASLGMPAQSRCYHARRSRTYQPVNDGNDAAHGVGDGRLQKL